jgi:hypothetical protein
MGRLSPFRDECYCHCWGSQPQAMCAAHDGCVVTPQHCAWPQCRGSREMHEEIGTGRVTLT